MRGGRGMGCLELRDARGDRVDGLGDLVREPFGGGEGGGRGVKRRDETKLHVHGIENTWWTTTESWCCGDNAVALRAGDGSPLGPAVSKTKGGLAWRGRGSAARRLTRGRVAICSGIQSRVDDFVAFASGV